MEKIKKDDINKFKIMIEYNEDILLKEIMLIMFEKEIIYMLNNNH